MRILSCKIKSDEASLSYPAKLSWTLVYDIDTDVRTTARDVLRQCFSASPDPIPPIYSYVGDGAYVTDVRVQRVKDTNASKWVAVVTCGQPQQGSNPSNSIDRERMTNPLRRIVLDWIEYSTEQDLITVDRFDNPIVNSAGRPFTEPLLEDRTVIFLCFQKNYATAEEVADLNQQYYRTNNEGDFRGNPTRTVKFHSATSGQPLWEYGIKYYTAIIRFAVKPSGWHKDILDRGWEYFDRPKTEPDAKLVNAVDDESQILHEPVLLNSDGTRRANDEAGLFKTFFVYEPKSDYEGIVADPL